MKDGDVGRLKDASDESVPESSLSRRKYRIGDLLVHNHMLDPAALDRALQEQQRSGEKLGQVLIRLGLMVENDLIEFLSHQLEIPIISLHRHHLRPGTYCRLPEEVAREHRALVLDEAPEHFLVGLVDPTDNQAREAVGRLLKKTVRLALIRESELEECIGILYSHCRELAFITGDED